MFSINSGLTFALVAMERNCWYGGRGRGWGMAVLALGPQLLNHTQKGTVVEIWRGFSPPWGFVYSKKTRLLLPARMWVWLRKETFLMTRNWDPWRQCLFWNVGHVLAAWGVPSVWILNVHQCFTVASGRENWPLCRLSATTDHPSEKVWGWGFSGSPGACHRVRDSWPSWRELWK